MSNHITKHKRISKRNSRHVVTIVAAVLLFLLYMIIFGFSAQDGEQSGGISYKGNIRFGSFADVCLDTCGGVFGVILCGFLEKVYTKIMTSLRQRIGSV